MSSSLNTVSEILAAIPKLTEWLPSAGNYLAHTHYEKASEKFEEHVKLVNEYFVKLCQAHGLDSVIDKLIKAIVNANFSEQSHEVVLAKIKEVFVAVIHFHDFGKVNENFQADKKKMNNPLFKAISDHPLGTSHSLLGAYLFVMKYIQEVTFPASRPTLNKEEIRKLQAIILLFSYVIIKHHAPELSEPLNGEISFKEEKEALREYVQLYQFDIHPGFTTIGPLQWQKGIFDVLPRILETDFSLFALLKLNFSLLTASDYLATHEYMANAPTTDFGVLHNRSRVQEIITNLRTTQPHNQQTFTKLHDFEFKHPTEKSMQNLNRLRQEMAVELIQTIRKHADRNLFYIEAPTGGGKTNLSMIALSELLEKNPELSKVYYVFPFTTLITQTYRALLDTLGLQADELVELHSKAGFHSKQEAAKDGVYGDEKKDYIDQLFALYPVTVLSHVKFFDLLKSNRKETNYLLHRLANSVVIIDELQSYNPSIWDKMLYFISQYAAYFNIRFVLMSATLPKISSLAIPMENKPIFTDLLPNAKRYLLNPNFSERVAFNFELFDKEITPEDLAETVISKSEKFASENEKHGSVYCIVEFIYKKSASSFREIIEQQDHPFDEIFVLSGTILEHRRKFIISYIKDKANREKNVLLITTQVVEAGVDIDMDLGFKNVSLIDSDEQLAGRVNRNADKGTCEVYLFKMDDASVLYRDDDRFKVTRDKSKISQSEYKRILKEKDFAFLYEHVFGRLDQINALNYADNFSNGMLTHVKKLNYNLVNKNFKIIDQQNESVFVPIALPIFIINSSDEAKETIFSDTDLHFLQGFGAYNFGDSEVEGAEVWQVYENLILNRENGFDMKAKLNFKLLQSIMAKFTFSLVSFSKLIPKLKFFCLNGDLTYGYYYLVGYKKVYSEETGLMESQFDASENYFL